MNKAELRYLASVPVHERDGVVLTRAQVRAGRALARLGIRDLAAAAGVSATAVSHIETGRTGQAHATTLRALRAALEGHGVEFADEGWVRRHPDRRYPDRR